MSLAEARRRRDQAREHVAAGRDPSQVRQEQKLAQSVATETSFKAVALAWLVNWKAARSPRHANYVLTRLEADVFPEIGRMPVAEITAAHLVRLATKIEARGALDIARRALQTCGQILRYAVAHGLAGRNPAADIKPSDVLKSRSKGNHARLDVKDSPELLRKMQAYAGNPYTRCALQLMALTFVRTGELIGAAWDEIDLEAAEWRIPAQRMKMRT